MMDQELVQKHMDAYEVALELRLPAPDPMSMMDLYKPMSFPRNKSGPFEIVTQTSDHFQITSMTHAQLLGVESISLNFGESVDFHVLTGDGCGIMASDKPDEIYIQYIAFHTMHGRVLVGGLGLGMAANMIAAMPNVDSVTVIEKEPEIIRLVEGTLDPKVSVIQADVFEYASALTAGQYDSAYYDTWYSTARREWGVSVVPLYRASRRAGIETLGSWGEHEMIAQLASALYMQSVIEESAWTPRPFWVFLQGLKGELGGKPPYFGKKGKIKELIKLYLYEVGSPEWEAAFPWDSYKAEGER
jgi:hypothetical protein